MKRRITFLFLIAYSLFLIAGCSVNKAETDSTLQKYFDGYKTDGCFTMLDNADGKITVYNMRLDTMRFLPASTFKIVNSLIGLEIGRIPDEKFVIKWDGRIRMFPGGDTATSWNKDLDFTEAFKASAVPYFQEVARRIGKDTMQLWLDSLHYGTGKITTAIDTFWLDNSLKISPDEQLGLVKRLYFDQLPFQKRSQQIVRDVMVQEKNTQYTLAYKTGWGLDEKGENIGWLTGWIEENSHPYFFTLLVKNGEKHFNMKAAREAILKNILRQYGFFEGRK